MLLSPHVPFVLKCGIAVGIVGTMGLFLCGVVARGAEVIPTVSTNHTVDVTLPPLYYLSLLGSIRDSYHAKVYRKVLTACVRKVPTACAGKVLTMAYYDRRRLQ